MIDDSTQTTLDMIFKWSLNASTQIAILIFLSVGVASTLWTLALRPLLMKFSRSFRTWTAWNDLEGIAPLLQSIGVLEQADIVRSVKRLRRIQPGKSEEVIRARLVTLMRQHYRSGQVRLGKRYSEPVDYFVDLRSAAVSADQLEELADILANFIGGHMRAGLMTARPVNIDRIVGIKEGNPLVVASAASKLHLPIAFYRGEAFPRFHGSDNPEDFVDGTVKAKETVVVVDDCTFRGTTILNAVEVARKLNANVAAVLLLFRTADATAERSLQALGIPLFSVLTLDDALLKRLQP